MSSGKSKHQSVLSEAYFKRISEALANAGVHQPTLVIDKAHLDHNLAAVQAITERGFDFRIVAKSLPSVPMLNYLMSSANTKRLMSFHMPFLKHVAENIPSAEILMGKPMPVAAVESFYQSIEKRHGPSALFDPETQLQWLIDSYERAEQYAALAEKLNIKMRISLEIDVGLHRGGFSEKRSFEDTLKFIKKDKHLELSGLLGYEAHITKVPSIVGGYKKVFDQAWSTYQSYVDSIVSLYGEAALQDLVLNTAGSTTYPLYTKTGLMNELATASALVKPTDFDVFTLDHHLPAAFIAAPVLKVVKDPELPAAKTLSRLMHRVGLLPRKACFIYGGNWLAEPCYPAGSKRANILGHSSNQEMYELKVSDNLQVDDFMYFRPRQSEAVFLQFGDIALFDNGEIVDWWPVFDQEPLRKPDY